MEYFGTVIDIDHVRCQFLVPSPMIYGIRGVHITPVYK